MITGLASAQAQYDGMEPADDSFTDAEQDRITLLVAAGMSAIRYTAKANLADFLDDIWAPEDSDAIRDAVKDAVLEELTGVLG